MFKEIGKTLYSYGHSLGSYAVKPLNWFRKKDNLVKDPVETVAKEVLDTIRIENLCNLQNNEHIDFLEQRKDSSSTAVERFALVSRRNDIKHENPDLTEENLRQLGREGFFQIYRWVGDSVYYHPLPKELKKYSY